MELIDEESQCIEMGLEPLEEAGGLVSWLKRLVRGRDDALPAELTAEVGKIKTKAEKDKALEEVDGYISKTADSKDSAVRMYAVKLKGVRAKIAALSVK